MAGVNKEDGTTKKTNDLKKRGYGQLKAIYNPQPNCQLCIELGWAPPKFCMECEKIRREEVNILELGVGIFGDNAVIQKSDGQLKTVALSALAII